VITVDADGALTVALANRMRLTASGLKVERSHVQAVLDAGAAEKVLDEIDPFADADEPPPPVDDLDPQLARARAMQAAREGGVLGGGDDRPNEYVPCVVEHRDIGSRPESDPVRVVAWLGPVGGRPLIMADAAAPSATVLALLDTVDGGALAVRAGGGTAALAFAICDDVLAPDLPTLPVSDKLSYGELVAALDAAIDGGATLLLLHSATTGGGG
jgi:hypothetical protein